jgi:hypothetical protein
MALSGGMSIYVVTLQELSELPAEVVIRLCCTQSHKTRCSTEGVLTDPLTVLGIAYLWAASTPVWTLVVLLPWVGWVGVLTEPSLICDNFLHRLLHLVLRHLVQPRSRDIDSKVDSASIPRSRKWATCSDRTRSFTVRIVKSPLRVRTQVSRNHKSYFVDSRGMSEQGLDNAQCLKSRCLCPETMNRDSCARADMFETALIRLRYILTWVLPSAFA